jgi:serine/threonine-protein kinase
MTDTVARLNAALTDRYRIERRIGAGGMATVFLADDLRHERKVALKVLRPELAAVVGAERFLAEIKTTANLQHPHILPLHDSGEADDLLFYVMPYVEGESLRGRLDRERQLPVDEAVRIATDVAAALGYAHCRGVIHRDIKPANILLQAGKPVVSDFGIALAVGAAGGGRLTETGLSLGTPHYMSPEQATGDLTVGPATDIYAVGCVLYEALVGEPPFTGSTPQAVLGNIIVGNVASSRDARPSVPLNVDGAIQKALEKVPADRFSTGDALAEALADAGFRWPIESPTTRGVRRGLVPILFTALAGFALWGWLRAPGLSESSAPARHTVIPLSDGHVLAMSGGSRYPVAISPDGRRIVYTAHDGRATRLYLRNLDDPVARPLVGTEGAWQPFFSPSGDEVGFFSGTELKKVPIAGGIPTPIAEVPAYRSGARWHGGSWGPDGTILYSLGESLWRVPEDGSGGSTEVVLVMAAEDGLPGTEAETEIPIPIKWPRFLPGGEQALVSTGWEDQAGVTGIVELRSGRFTPLILGGEPHYLKTGHLALAGGGERVVVVPIDLERLEVGNPVPVLEGVARGPAGGATTFTVSETGTLGFARGGFERSIFLVDRFGRADSVPVEPRGYRFPSISADGHTLAISVDPRPSHIWIVDLVRGDGSPIHNRGLQPHPSVLPGWIPPRLQHQPRDRVDAVVPAGFAEAAKCHRRGCGVDRQRCVHRGRDQSDDRSRSVADRRTDRRYERHLLGSGRPVLAVGVAIWPMARLRGRPDWSPGSVRDGDRWKRPAHSDLSRRWNGPAMVVRW